MDGRRLQRTVFRMQHDAAFAARLLRGDPDALGSTGLGAEELASLRAVPPVAFSADRGGHRAAQLLRNVSSELPLSVAVGPDGQGGRGWIEAFPATHRFHDAVARDARLPCAFARHAEEAAEGASPAFRALVGLESALVFARRSPAPEPVAPLPSGWVRRAARARLLRLPEGAFALAERVREALEAGAAKVAATAAQGALGPSEETILLLVRPAPSRWTLPEIHVEPLPALVAAFLEAAASPRSPSDRAGFAAQHGLEAGEVERVVREFVAEGALDAG